MRKALQVRWHGLEPSDAVVDHVQKKADHLERYYPRITGCVVTLEEASRHHRHSGGQYRVRVELSVPGQTLVVGRHPPRSRAHTDLHAAVDAAFREARRQLLDHARRIDGRVKAHAPEARAEVVRVFPENRFGFLRTADGRDVYFHANAVLGTEFARLRTGTPVRFVEEPGDEGPQATTVRCG